MSTTTEEKQSGYKGHNAGSRKEQVHCLYDTKGPEAAMAWGVEQGLKEGTIKSWIGFWKRAEGEAAPKAAPNAKPNGWAKQATSKKKDGRAKGRPVEKKQAGDGRQTVEGEAEEQPNEAA